MFMLSFAEGALQAVMACLCSRVAAVKFSAVLRRMFRFKVLVAMLFSGTVYGFRQVSL
jgi:hypothetical protein